MFTGIRYYKSNLVQPYTNLCGFYTSPPAGKDLNNLVICANNGSIAAFITKHFPQPYSIENGKAFIAFAFKDIPLHIFAMS